MKEKRKFPLQRRSRFERLNIVASILIAGWVPSALMLAISYTVLTRTLETKILRDRQTFVQLIAHLVGDDLTRTGDIVGYYQTSQTVAEILRKPAPQNEGRRWLNEIYFSHPRIDGMFLTDASGRLLAAIPPQPAIVGEDFASADWIAGAQKSSGVFISSAHPRSADGRPAVEIVGAVRTRAGETLGYVGVSVLVERIGRRLDSVQFADQTKCQILDQTGAGLFPSSFQMKTELPGARAGVSPNDPLRPGVVGHFERDGIIYSFAPIESSGWITVVEQPRAVAYQAVTELMRRTTYLAGWLIVGTAVIAWLASKVYRRQTEAAARIEREVTFNDKILANMPSGIALVDPASRRFLQANEAFAQMARHLGKLPNEREILRADYDEVAIAPRDAINKVLQFGVPFQLIEQPMVDPVGMTHFVNVNLLRLQDSQQIVQGVLYLVEDKTRDVRLRQELISANAAKDQFLALLSHELRNPLSPVLAMVAELETRLPNEPETRQSLEIIRRNVELEARLIDDLLDVTRIAKGKLQLSFEPVSIHETLRRAYEICREDIAENQLHFAFHFDAPRDTVSGDPARLQQVFWNLIKNAVKFTPAGGNISVTTSNPSSDQIEICTRDSGIGIGPEKIRKVFNAFEQGQSSITRRFGGLGLGLAISKAMVRAHGGSISVESDGADRGSTFTILLHTIATPAPVSEAPAPRLTTPAATEDTPASPARRPHLLVVDDHHDTCLGMKMLLERRGYRITLAHSASQAVEKARAENFDLLISDIGLPDRSGYELMQELHETQALRGLALSGFGMENDIAKAQVAGFSQHLTKPVNFDQLEEAIRRLLSERNGE